MQPRRALSAIPRRSRRSAAPLAILTLLLLLAACSSGGAKTSTTQSASPTTSSGPLPTSTTAPSVVAITDLDTFRTTLASAFTGGRWEQVAALLSPSFTFQGSNTGGAQLIMPDAANEFKSLYTGNLSWSQQNSSHLSIYRCFIGNTPDNQVMLFAGSNNVLAIVGAQRWQGYWVLGWAFQNTLDGSGYCL